METATTVGMIRVNLLFLYMLLQYFGSGREKASLRTFHCRSNGPAVPFSVRYLFLNV